MNISRSIIPLPLSAFVYTSLPRSWRWWFLVLVHAAFLVSFGLYRAVVFPFVAVVSHSCAVSPPALGEKPRTLILRVSVATIVASFFLSKGVFRHAWLDALGSPGERGSGPETFLHVVGTVGLSYSSFRAIGYLVDV